MTAITEAYHDGPHFLGGRIRSKQKELHMEIRDFEFIWRLRAVLCESVVVENDPAFEGVTEVWMWFVGDWHHDEWFALALSDYATLEHANRISDMMDDAEMSALLPYAGEPWDNIAYTSPVAFGSQQRTLYASLQGEPMATLMGMSREQILALRVSESPADKAHLN